MGVQVRTDLALEAKETVQKPDEEIRGVRVEEEKDEEVAHVLELLDAVRWVFVPPIGKSGSVPVGAKEKYFAANEAYQALSNDQKEAVQQMAYEGAISKMDNAVARFTIMQIGFGQTITLSDREKVEQWMADCDALSPEQQELILETSQYKQLLNAAEKIEELENTVDTALFDQDFAALKEWDGNVHPGEEDRRKRTEEHI